MEFIPRSAAGWLAFMIHILIACSTAGADEGAGKADAERPLVVAFTPQVFFNVDPRDAIGAARVWINNADRKLGNPIPSVVLNFSHQSEVENALDRNEVDILIMIADDFTALRETYDLVPALSTDYGRNFYDELLLMVRADSAITTVRQLHGKKIRIEGGQKGTIPTKWLKSLLRSRGVSPPKEFFGSINEFPKASLTIMPVFSGQADSRTSSLTSFETMPEPNPQPGRKLKILGKSPGFATGIVAVRGGIQNRGRDALIEALRTMDGDAKGKQVLTLFRINLLVPFRSEHLASEEKLFGELRGEPEKRIRRN